MPESECEGGHVSEQASDAVALLKRQYRDVEKLFRRIADAHSTAERYELLDEIMQKLTLRRILAVLLRNCCPLCERCLARLGRVTPTDVAAALFSLGRVITLNVEQAECPECQQSTRTFFLAPRKNGVLRVEGA
jgi:hypothetical protein